MDLFTALAAPTRRNILELLVVSGQLPAAEIYNKFQISHPAISQHLKVLREANLVMVEKRAQTRLYQVNPAAITEFEGWVLKMKSTWDGRFEKLDAILELEKQKLFKTKHK